MPLVGSGASRCVRRRAGFTLLELLTALIVLGVASTVLLKMFTSSQSLAKSARSHEIAGDLAQEYLTLIESRPDLFVWPDFTDTQPGTAEALKPRDGGPVAALTIDPPATLPLTRRAHDREADAYRDFSWSAEAIAPAADAQFVAVTVQVAWELEGRVRQFTMGSVVPRVVTEGSGQ